MGIFHLKRGQKEAFFDPPHLVHVVFEQPLSLLATTKPIPETAHFLITQSKNVKKGRYIKLKMLFQKKFYSIVKVHETESYSRRTSLPRHHRQRAPPVAESGALSSWHIHVES